MSTAAIPVLALNSGSSSLKFSLYLVNSTDHSKTPHWLADGAIERIGLPDSRMWLKRPGTPTIEGSVAIRHHHDAVAAVFSLLSAQGIPSPQAVGHRLVSGGPRYVNHQLITAAFRADIKNYFRFAPLHLPAEVQAIDAVTQHFPDIPQAACFDTAFHQHIPEVAARLPLPRNLWQEGIKKYGFHGLSYEYLVSQLPVNPQERIVAAHLGNGASLAAIQNGQSVDTTMGLTPTGGLIMGTRPGDLDPGVLVYLINEKGYSGAELEHLLDHLSGLLGISGISPDMQTLLASSDPDAQLAIDMFAYSIRKAVAAMAAALGGLDTLIFTGGIGEHAPLIRHKVCEALGFLAITIDDRANAQNAPVISTPTSQVTVRVIPTNEDIVIARHTVRLIQNKPA
ncbi:acetate/propionate family kinase [Sulfobacillus sp. hq2]|uniref:acetate/propionate family kinase n=1 Tax=Sulfobacillus TaxID=28033 RepID=UPI000CD21B9B|nr:acetate/propionate family kinase [Sulfobacillus sp. hq2]POB09875.1 acetate kinase [Sulfobacillus sp. hq2]